MTFLRPLLASFSLLAFAATPAYAAEEAKNKRETRASAGATAEPKSFAELDTNKDGFIQRAEIAAHAGLAAKFKAADKDGDGKLSRSEYDAMIEAERPAAAGGTTKKDEKKPAK